MIRASAIRLFVAVSLLALGTAPAPAQSVIQGFDAARDGGPNPFHTGGFVTGSMYTDVRDAVSSEYGAAVSFGSPAFPEGVPAVTIEALAGSDIFVVTGMTVALSAEESCLLQEYVRAGGALLSFRNEWTPPTLLGTGLGDFDGTGFAQIADAASPLIAGPFGTVSGPVRVGANSAYADTGGGSVVLTDNGEPMLLSFDSAGGYAGRAVIAGDEEVFLNGPTPFDAETWGTLPNNQILFKNIIAFLLDAPGLDAAGEEGLQVCLDADHDGASALDDCDDGDPAVRPGAEEVLDGRDNDCDGQVDEDLDGDGDGVLDRIDMCPGTEPGSAVDPDGCAVDCSGGEVVDDDGDGFPLPLDCDDADPAINPGAVDVPGNRVDEDCDGVKACDPDAGWASQGQFVSCVARESRALACSGDLAARGVGMLVSEAARSFASGSGDDGGGDLVTEAAGPTRNAPRR